MDNIPDIFTDGMAGEGITADRGEGGWSGSSGYIGDPEETVVIGLVKQ